MTEAASRQENQTRRRMKAAAFPFQKTLDEFDMTQLNPSVSPVFLNELASCKFIDECRNIVMIGNPGRGKTHIAIALGIGPKAGSKRRLIADKPKTTGRTAHRAPLDCR